VSAKRITVLYQGKRVGELLDVGHETGFAYSDSFLASGHQLSPLKLPLERKVFSNLYDNGMYGLPGILYDSLPDSYGRKIMYDWYAKKMGDKYLVTAADMLAYVGHNGMGALVYEPANEEYDAAALKELDLAKAERETRSYLEGRSEEVLESLRATAKTVGGSFPKALVALDPATGKTYEERRGLPLGFEHWIVKFGIGDQRPRQDFSNYPELEMAYLEMANDCGISVPGFRPFETTDKNGKRLVHLGIRRFDLENGQRLHYASLAGLMEESPDYDYWSYDHLIDTTLKVVKDFRAIKEQCRRMIFNVGSANLDDHCKNHGFLYDGKEWRISPAFDLGYWGFKPNAAQALGVGALIRQIPFERMRDLCDRAGIPKAEVDEMGEQIRSVLEKAPAYLKKWNVPPDHSRFIVDDLSRRIETSLTVKRNVAGGLPAKKNRRTAALENPTSLEDMRKHSRPDVPSPRKEPPPPTSQDRPEPDVDPEIK
jgi:serine/threonine-protein kinase HipA